MPRAARGLAASRICNLAPNNITLSATAVAENASAGTVVGNLAASDFDLTDTHTYTLLDDAGGRFVLNGATVKVAAGAQIDFETATAHDIIVRATDQGGRFVDKTLSISVNDINEAPTDVSLSVTSVAENTWLGPVLGNLSASDADAGDTFLFTLLDDAGGRFVLNGAAVKTAELADLDFETAQSHTITVRVTDKGGKYFDKALTISVTNVNEAPYNLGAFARTVSENAANGTTVIELFARDWDAGDMIAYSLIDDANGRFAIEGNTVVVLNGAAIDFERQKTQTVTVRATDQGGKFMETTLMINVTNVNEAPTDITLSATAVAENAANASVVGFLATSDPDAGNTFTYALLNDAGGRFHDSGRQARGRRQPRPRLRAGRVPQRDRPRNGSGREVYRQGAGDHAQRPNRRVDRGRCALECGIWRRRQRPARTAARMPIA